MKKGYVSFYLDVYELSDFRIGIMIDATCPIFLLQSEWPWQWFKVTGLLEIKSISVSLGFFHKVFNWFGWNVVWCWDLLVWWNSYSSHPVNAQGREPYQGDFIERTLTLECAETSTSQFLSNLVWQYAPTTWSIRERREWYPDLLLLMWTLISRSKR